MRVLDKNILKNKITATALADIESGKVGGIATAVIQEGQTVYQEFYNNEKLGIYVKEDTLFRMASMTKPITGVAALILVDRGELNLDTPVSYYIPEFEKMNVGRKQQGKFEVVGQAKTPVTLRHILTHSSGMSGDAEAYLGSIYPARERKSLAQAVQVYAGCPLEFEPGTRQMYSGAMAFDVLSRVLEIVSGMCYDEFLKKEIFLPLGMEDTTFAPTEEQWARMIPMHSGSDGVPKVVASSKTSVFSQYPTTCCCGGAGLASTLRDYKKFAGMLLNRGSVNGRQIISEKMIDEMSRPQLSQQVMRGPMVWGLSVRVIVDDSYGSLPRGSFGWSGAYGTHFWIDPTNNVTAIYLRNSADAKGAGDETLRQFEWDVNAAYVTV